MRPPNQPTPRLALHQDGPDPSDEQPPAGRRAIAGAGLGAVALMALCCAGPALLTAGVLAGTGTAIRSPWALGAAAFLVLVAAGLTVRRALLGRGGGDRFAAGACCPPGRSDRRHHHAERPADRHR